MIDMILLATLACCSGFFLFSVGGIILHAAEKEKLFNNVTFQLLAVALLSAIGALCLYWILNLRIDEHTINYWILGLTIGFFVTFGSVLVRAPKKTIGRE